MIRRAMLFMGILMITMLCSCIGISTDITIRRDGSGTIKLEYRMAQELESLGKLDGNERWLPVPVGKADFERTAARIRGLKMRSFQSRLTGKDLINQVNLEFTDTDALLRFLDAAGQGASLTREGGQNRLSLSLGGDNGALDQDLADLVSQAWEGYTWDFRVSLPGEAEFTALNQGGEKADSQWVRNGTGKGSYSAPMGKLLSSPVRLEIRWPL